MNAGMLDRRRGDVSGKIRTHSVVARRMNLDREVSGPSPWAQDGRSSAATCINFPRSFPTRNKQPAQVNVCLQNSAIV